MSLVGTRPPTVDEWELYEPHHRARMSFRPGLTGMWQVSGRSNITDFEEVVKLDTQYIVYNFAENNQVLRDKNTVNLQQVRLVFAGTTDFKDYLEPLLRAIRKINNNDVKVIFDVIGPSADTIKNMIKCDNPVQYGINCHGRLSHENTLSIVKKADFSVLMRENKRYAKAGVSTKFVEAMSLAVPSICTAVGGTDAFVSDGVDGFLIKDTDNVLHAAIDAGVKRVVCLSTDKAAYPINAMGISKAMMEHVIYANARVAAERGGTTICCTRYGNVMCSRGSVIPLFIDQIKAGNPITITDPNMTRFLMNLDEAVDLVMFAFQHGNPGDLFIQKSDASTIGDLAKAVQQLFGDTGTNIIGTRHGEKLFETLMTREERLRSEDMGHYFRVAADNRDLNYDKFVVKGEVHTMADESYTSHNTNRLDVEGTVKKIMTTEYVQNELKGIPNV